MDNQLANTLDNLLQEDIVNVWDLEGAVHVCRVLEPVAPNYGAHVALTGGCLYKDGKRKDADVMFYRIRQIKVIDEIGLLKAIQGIGFEIIRRSGWVVKAKFDGKPLDLFFPEELTVDLSGKCLDNQYPEGPECSRCGANRELIDGQWKHTKECSKKFWADKVGIDYILKTNPITGDKHCPTCEEKLVFDLTKDRWEHAIPDNPNYIGKEAVANTTTGVIKGVNGVTISPDNPGIIRCSKLLHVWNSYDVPGTRLCPGCGVRLLGNGMNYYHPR